MKLVVLYGLITSVLLSFGSCKNTDDEFLPDDVLPPVPEGYVRMQITVPGLTPVSTYALNAVDETHVSTVGVLVFKDGPNANDDTYLCYAAVTEPSKITDTGSTKTFDVDLRAAGNITDAYVMVVANASVDTLGFAASRPTKEAVMQSVTFASSGKWNVAKTNDTDFTPLPMWGMTDSPVSLASASSIPSISLIRSVARIDVGLKFPDNVTDGTETATGLGSTFTLEEIYLYNSLNKGSIAPYSGKYSGTTVTVPSIPDSPSAPGINDSPVPSYLSSNGTADGFSANKFSCTGAIYMTEHAAGDRDALSTNPYLVIGGKYNGSGTVTYYRLDFVSGSYPSQTFLSVLRNHRYRFNITKVDGPGYESVTAAAEARPVNLTYDLSATDESLTSYDYNGQYALGVSQDSYTLDKTARTVSTLKVSTTYGDGYTAVSSNTSWLVITGGASTSTANAPGSPTTMTFSVTGGVTSARTDTIIITAGRLKKKVLVNRKSTADGFSVTDPASEYPATSATTRTDIKVTSSYKWYVRVKNDSKAIISSFTASGDPGSNLTFSFGHIANPYYEKPAATFVFFSPTNEFTEVEKTVSLTARVYTAPANPTGHGGWAGSNIYWNGSYLTFDDTPASTPSTPTAAEKRQGVFFKWGSLVGLDPMRYTSGAIGRSWNSANIVYVPNYNSSNPTASGWTNPTASGSGLGYDTWTNIPYVTSGSGSVTNYAHLTLNASNQSGGYDPANRLGDICRYLSETGKAPGSPGVRWRMPTAAEFASPSGITAESQDYIKTANGWGDVTDSFSGNAAGTWAPADGRRKKYDHASQTVLTYQPFFPAGGHRATNTALYEVGSGGDYWASSPHGSLAYNLDFDKNYAYPAYDYGDRTYGFRVRCVKEL